MRTSKEGSSDKGYSHCLFTQRVQRQHSCHLRSDRIRSRVDDIVWFMDKERKRAFGPCGFEHLRFGGSNKEIGPLCLFDTVDEKEGIVRACHRMAVYQARNKVYVPQYLAGPLYQRFRVNCGRRIWLPSDCRSAEGCWSTRRTTVAGLVIRPSHDHQFGRLVIRQHELFCHA